MKILVVFALIACAVAFERKLMKVNVVQRSSNHIVFNCNQSVDLTDLFY